MGKWEKDFRTVQLQRETLEILSGNGRNAIGTKNKSGNFFFENNCDDDWKENLIWALGKEI